MRAALSIVIPVLDAAGYLPATFGSLGEGLSAGLIREVIVTDGGSVDATKEIADTAGALWIDGAPGRGGQLRRGVDRASGAWVLVLHADTQLANGWSDAVLRHMAEHPDAAGYFRLAFDVKGLAPSFVAGWANLRSRVFGLPYGDQGLLIPRALYDQIGGYADIPLMEDVVIARALRGRLRRLQATATTSAARYILDGWLQRGGRNLLTLTRFFLGADPKMLARNYRASE